MVRTFLRMHNNLNIRCHFRHILFSQQKAFTNVKWCFMTHVSTRNVMFKFKRANILKSYWLFNSVCLVANRTLYEFSPLEKKTEFNLMVIVLFLDSDEWKLTVSENVKYSIELKWAFNSKCFQRMCIRPSENFNLSHSQCVLNRRVNYFSKFFFFCVRFGTTNIFDSIFYHFKIVGTIFHYDRKVSLVDGFIWKYLIACQKWIWSKKNPFDLF